jgi:CMP-N,N'-diacetyllegionaminic acid synthase
MNSGFLVIIPARGGSKGIVKKNIVKIHGKPLIQYTVEPAVRLIKEEKVDEAIVSTDSREIADISEKLGISVPFIRPKELAGDKSKSVDVILHALDYFENKNMFFYAVVLLQPTVPLRSYEDIVNSIDLFCRKDSDSLITVHADNQLSDLVMYKKDGCFAVPLNQDHNKGVRRQNFKKTYVRNGAVYITRVDYLRKNKKVISDRPLLYEMPKNRSVNIDSYDDLEVAECILKKLGC